MSPLNSSLTSGWSFCSCDCYYFSHFAMALQKGLVWTWGLMSELQIFRSINNISIYQSYTRVIIKIQTSKGKNRQTKTVHSMKTAKVFWEGLNTLKRTGSVSWNKLHEIRPLDLNWVDAKYQNKREKPLGY